MFLLLSSPDLLRFDTHSLSKVKTDAVSAHESGLTDPFGGEEHISVPATAGVNGIHTPHNCGFVSHLRFPLWPTLALNLLHCLFLFLLLTRLLLLQLWSYLFLSQHL